MRKELTRAKACTGRPVHHCCTQGPTFYCLILAMFDVRSHDLFAHDNEAPGCEVILEPPLILSVIKSNRAGLAA